jgi:hypothetical protein
MSTYPSSIGCNDLSQDIGDATQSSTLDSGHDYRRILKTHVCLFCVLLEGLYGEIGRSNVKRRERDVLS